MAENLVKYFTQGGLNGFKFDKYSYFLVNEVDLICIITSGGLFLSRSTQ